MNANPRMIFGGACLAAGLALLVLPPETVPWLPGAQAAGGILCLSGAMFLIRAWAARREAAGGAPPAAPTPRPAPRHRRRREKPHAPPGPRRDPARPPPAASPPLPPPPGWRPVGMLQKSFQKD
jgi:hypothetical protein